MMMNSDNFNSSSNLAVHVPPWDLGDDPTATMLSPFKLTTTVSVNFNGNNNNNNATSPNGDLSPLDSLHRYLPSNTTAITDFHGDDDSDIPADAFSCDQFRMYEFKVRKCARARSHDWTECPYAHPGEKARRRDPRKYHYSGTACPEFRKGLCKKGETCEYAHGVFECWLHPARYRTQPCKDGTHCRRRVCFFAHTPDQLRIWPHIFSNNNNNNSFKSSDSYDGSPSRLGIDSIMVRDSPTSTLYSPPSVSPPSDSPPMSPNRVNSVSELALSMRNLRMSVSPPAWGVGLGSGFCSPRSPSKLRPGFLSLPSTPIQAPTRHGLGVFDLWDQTCEEEPVMERVESGKDLRAKIYSKLSKDNSFDRVDSAALGPDLGWVSELIK